MDFYIQLCFDNCDEEGLLQDISEGDCILGPSKHHHHGTAICPRLPDEFLAFCGNALDYSNGYNPIRFFWQMLL